MKKLKKINIIELMLLVIGVLIIVLSIFLIFNAGNNVKNNKHDNKINVIKSLLKNDYDISNYMYGNPSVSEESVTFYDITYYHLNESSITSIGSYQKLINETYIDNLLTTAFSDMDKYNKYVEVENKLYVNINSKCSIDKFDDKVSIVNETDDIITVKNNNRQVTISKDGSIYKLKKSAYICK